MFSIISIASFLVIVLLFTVSKRTRIVAIPLAILWLVGHAIRDFVNDQLLLASFLLVVAVFIAASAVRDRKKHTTRIKG